MTNSNTIGNTETVVPPENKAKVWRKNSIIVILSGIGISIVLGFSSLLYLNSDWNFSGYAAQTALLVSFAGVLTYLGLVSYNVPARRWLSMLAIGLSWIATAYSTLFVWDILQSNNFLHFEGKLLAVIWLWTAITLASSLLIALSSGLTRAPYVFTYVTVGLGILQGIFGSINILGSFSPATQIAFDRVLMVNYNFIVASLVLAVAFSLIRRFWNNDMTEMKKFGAQSSEQPSVVISTNSLQNVAAHSLFAEEDPDELITRLLNEDFIRISEERKKAEPVIPAAVMPIEKISGDHNLS